MEAADLDEVEEQQRIREEASASGDWFAGQGGPPLKEWEAAALLELLHVDRKSRKAGMAFMKAYLANEGVILDDASIENFKRANKYQSVGSLQSNYVDRRNSCRAMGFHCGSPGSSRQMRWQPPPPPAATSSPSKKPQQMPAHTWEGCKEQIAHRLREKGRLTSKDVRDIILFFQQVCSISVENSRQTLINLLDELQEEFPLNEEHTHADGNGHAGANRVLSRNSLSGGVQVRRKLPTVTENAELADCGRLDSDIDIELDTPSPYSTTPTTSFERSPVSEYSEDDANLHPEVSGCGLLKKLGLKTQSNKKKHGSRPGTAESINSAIIPDEFFDDGF